MEQSKVDFNSMNSDQRPTTMNEEKYSPDNTLGNKNDNEMTNIDESDQDLETLSKFTKLVAPIYITVAVLSLVFMIVSAATKKVWGGILVWLMTLIMSYFGCWGGIIFD